MAFYRNGHPVEMPPEEPKDTTVHHCWTVLTTGDAKHVIDLCDDFVVMYASENGNRIQAVEDPIARREMMADFELEAQKHPHHVRCFPLGCPTPPLLYIGCECDPKEGIQIWNDLIDRFPNHECRRNLGENAMSLTQSICAKHGLMDWTKEHHE